MVLVVIDLAAEITLEIGAEVRTETQVPAGRHPESGQDRHGHTPHIRIGNIGSGKIAGHGIAVHGKGHLIILDIGAGMEPLVEEVPSHAGAPALAEHLIYIHTDGGSALGREGIDRTDFRGQGQGGSAAHCITCTDKNTGALQPLGGTPFLPGILSIAGSCRDKRNCHKH